MLALFAGNDDHMPDPRGGLHTALIMGKVEEHLLKNLDMFRGFVRARVSDPELAADVVQDSLLKAIKAEDTVRDDENVVAWFYRIRDESGIYAAD